MPVDSGLEIALVLDVHGDLGSLAAPSGGGPGDGAVVAWSIRTVCPVELPWRQAATAQLETIAIRELDQFGCERAG